MKKITKAIIGSLLATSLIAVSLPSFAGYHHRQAMRHHHLHHVNKRMHRQEHKANRALRHGNIFGYFRHQAHADHLRHKKHHIKHHIQRARHHHHDW